MKFSMMPLWTIAILMGNAQRAVDLLLGNELRKLLHLSDASLALQHASGDDSNARGVIAAVFKPPQSLNQDIRYVTLGGSTDNSTHNWSSSEQ